MSIPSELGHLEVPIHFLAKWKNQRAQASFEPGTSRSRVLRSAVAPHWLGVKRMMSLTSLAAFLHGFDFLPDGVHSDLHRLQIIHQICVGGVVCNGLQDLLPEKTHPI